MVFSPGFRKVNISYVLFNDLQSVTSVSLSFSLIHLNELWTHLSANSLPIQLLPIRPAKTVCQRTVDSSQRFFYYTQQYNNYCISSIIILIIILLLLIIIIIYLNIHTGSFNLAELVSMEPGFRTIK